MKPCEDASADLPHLWKVAPSPALSAAIEAIQGASAPQLTRLISDLDRLGVLLRRRASSGRGS